MSWIATAGLTLTAYQGYSQAESNNKTADKNYKSAIEAQADDNTQLNEQTRQQEEIDADKNLEARIQALRAQSTLQAQGRNVSGTSVDRQQQAVNNSLGSFLQDSMSNMEATRRQLEMNKKGITTQTQSRINSTPKTKYNPTVDIISTGLTIYGGFSDAKATAAKNDTKAPSFKDYATGDWKK